MPTEAEQALQFLARLLSGSADTAALVADTEAWDLIRRHAADYGVSAPVAFTARPHASAEQRAWCDAVLTRNWRRHDAALLHLQNVLDPLARAGIPVLSLKGPLLARRHYQPAFVRKSSLDVDLAVREADIDRTALALAPMGYVQVKSLAAARTFGYDVPLMHTSLPRIELHFRLSHGAIGIPVDEFFGRAVSADLPNGTTALVLSEADEILHLILHLAHHRFPVLFNLYEIRRLWLRAPAQVRTEVLGRAREHGFVGALTVADVQFEAIWGARTLSADMPLPQTWLGRRLDREFYRRCARWSAPGVRLSLRNRIAGRWLDFQMTDSPADALRFLKMFAAVGWFRLLHGGWKTLQFTHFVPPD